MGKVFIAIIATILLGASSIIIAQVPQGIPYQAVARDGAGQPLDNQAVKVRFSILDSIVAGPVVYAETHTVTTSPLGLFTANVGMGTVVSGSFSNINWGQNFKFLKVELDTTGVGNNYINLGTQQMLSVPYAFYSGSAATVSAGGGTQGQILTYCNGVPTWTTGGQCPAYVSFLACSAATNTGTLEYGVTASSVTSSIPYSGGNGSPFIAQSFSSTGVTGLTATLSAGNLNNGSGNIVITIIGTPTSAGVANFQINFGGQTCNLSRSVAGTTTTGISTSTCGATNVLNPSVNYGTMVDQNGNVYKTVVIGSQTWMAENLKASHYRNGDLIPVVTSATTWASLTTGATCWYNNDSVTYSCPYGKLYNWYAVNDPRNVCPVGWHVPTNAEFATLATFINNDGNGMRTVGAQYWTVSNTAATNTYGFSALGYGFRGYVGDFLNIGGNGYYWSKTASNLSAGWNRQLKSNDPTFILNSFAKVDGINVRCLKD